MQMNNKNIVRSTTPKDKPLKELKQIYKDATKNSLPNMKKGK